MALPSSLESNLDVRRSELVRSHWFQLVDQLDKEIQSVGHPQITGLELQTSVRRCQPPIPGWKRLISRPLPRGERISLITVIFAESNEADVVNLHGDDAQTFVDVIDEVLSHSFTLEPVT